MRFEVKRRYNDFFWLRSYLVREFPCFIIPPIDEKTTKLKQQDDIFLKKRMLILESFLNAIIDSHELRSSPAVLAFLKEPADSFTKMRNIFEKSISKISVDFSNH